MGFYRWARSYTEGDIMARGFWERIILPELQLPNTLEVILEDEGE